MNKPVQKDEELLQRLFSQTRARPQPPPDFDAEMKSLLHAQWQQNIRSRKRKRLFTGAAVAASLVLAVLLVDWNAGAPPSSSVAVAQLVRQSGKLLVQPPVSAQGPQAGQLFTGQLLETSGGSRAAMEWAGGLSIRLDENTQLRLLSASQVELLSGQIYLDSGQPGSSGHATDSDAFSIRARGSLIAHRGTQYITRLNVNGIEVLVREGVVELDHTGGEMTARAGQKLHLSLSGLAETLPINTWGQAWSWAEHEAPPFELDGIHIDEFLQKVARETGHILVYEDSRAEHIARTETLQGKVDLPPARALDLVLKTTDLEASMEEGEIRIRTR